MIQDRPICAIVIRVRYIKAEFEWSGSATDAGDGEQSPIWQVPFAFGLMGVGGAVFGSYPWQWILPGVALFGLSLFLDLREYPPPANPGDPVPVQRMGTLFLVPMIGMALMSAVYFFASQTLLHSTVLIVILLVAGIAEPFLRTKLALEVVKHRMRQLSHAWPRPFLIAHSLGTYLTGHVIQEHMSAGLMPSRIIYTGCVLDRDFPWQNVAPPNTEGLISVTNFVGRLDLVPWLTGMLRGVWLLMTVPVRFVCPRFIDFLARFFGWRSLGNSGIHGFRTHQAAKDIISDVEHLWATHSKINQDPLFQRWAWLPFLWGIRITEMQRWEDFCRAGSHSARPATDAAQNEIVPYCPNDPEKFAYFEKKILELPWQWADDPRFDRQGLEKRLSERVIEILRYRRKGTLAEHTGLLDRLPKFLFDTVNDAYEESLKPHHANPEILRHLRPQAALETAVVSALNAK